MSKYDYWVQLNDLGTARLHVEVAKRTLEDCIKYERQHSSDPDTSLEYEVLLRSTEHTLDQIDNMLEAVKALM
ncbi:MAG: hypothetical protein WCV62_06770 [Candidatus Peribacteraceae bacterium]|jgi:hypothetical protein